MTKLRIISDLHYTNGINGPDYDKTYKRSGLWHYFGKKLQEPVDYTLIAGDICEGIEKHQEFFEAFFPNKKVIFIDGNHCVYFRQKDTIITLSKIKEKLEEKFPITHLLWHYLENNWFQLDENTYVIGSTFYTDYNYCDLTLEEMNKHKKAWDNCVALWLGETKEPEKFVPYEKLTKSIIRNETMFTAHDRMNDFRWGYETKGLHLTPQYYRQLHKLAKKEVKRCHDEILSKNPNAKIILMTHHCLSSKVILEKYKKSLINASYTSDLEKWIDKKLPGVRLVISGHVHNRCDFTFGKRKVRYIVNPCGYIGYHEPFDEPKFNPNLIIDTKDL